MMERKKIFLAVVFLLVVCFVFPIKATIQPSFQGVSIPPDVIIPGEFRRDFLSYVHAVSDDGSVVVGFGISPYEICGQAYRWENGEIVGLGTLPAGEWGSEAYGVSADGSVIVGDSSRAFRWENGTMVGLPGGDSRSCAYDVSADGSVVVGWSNSDLGTEAFRWENETIIGLGDLSGGGFGSLARAVSADGSVIVGESSSASGNEAFLWENGVMVGLGDLPGGEFYSAAFGVSADGSVIVGESVSASGTEAFRWTAETGMVGLGDLPGGEFYSAAFGVSADGSVIVGISSSASGYEAFRWEDLNNNGMVDPGETLDNHPEFGLGDLPGGSFYSCAYDVSADGSVVVGGGISGFDPPFIWDETNGMRNLKDILVNDCGLDLTNWQLYNATGISADGFTIVGDGRGPPQGFERGWIATIPEPATVLMLGLGGLMLRRKNH